MRQKGEEINAGKYDYKIPTPCNYPTLCHVQNCNTVTKALLDSVGIEIPQEIKHPDGAAAWLPGLNADFKHTQFDRFLKKVETTFQTETNSSFVVQDGELLPQSGVQFNLTVGDSIMFLLKSRCMFMN